MTTDQNRAEFIQRVWDYLVSSEVPSHSLSGWVPSRLLDSFGTSVTRQDLGKIDLRDTEICTLCFAQLHRFINRQWPRLSAEFKLLVERSLNELNLWDGFDRYKVRVSNEQRDAVRVRFDIADITFGAGKEAFDEELSLYVTPEHMRIRIPGKENEQKVRYLVQRRVAARAHIDLAVLIFQKIPRGRDIMSKIVKRVRVEGDRCYELLRDLLLNSTIWTTPQGQSFLSKDELPSDYLNDAYMQTDRRLVNYVEFVDKLVASLDTEVPPRNIVDQVSDMMRRYEMVEQNVTTNIQVTNSQIGVLNTGSIKDVHSIDASITTLKSKGDMDIGDAFRKITEGIMSDEVLSEKNKTELLSNVKYLSEAAAKGKDDRNSSVIKSVLRSVSDVLDVAGPAVRTLLPLVAVIAEFFGLSV